MRAADASARTGGEPALESASAALVRGSEDLAHADEGLPDAAVPAERVAQLAGPAPLLAIEGLCAGYGRMEILHDLDLRLGAGQSLCLIGPNGAGKSTVLNAVFGFADVRAGRITVGGEDLGRLRASERLRRGRIAYVLQDGSIFPDLTVEQNLWLGGYLMPERAGAKAAAERIFERYPRLASRRREPARVLSGGERRLLEISRALMMEPRLLLVDEPSIGLEPRFIELVFDTLRDLQSRDGISILMVEQNAKKGLEFADVGYVLVAGRLAMAGPGRELLHDPAVGRLFLGG